MEYVDDVPYVRHFLADLSPARLRLTAALNGIRPPPDTDFDYCELGCAHGDTLVALAAANPESRFLGVDLSASHVASAKRLARDGALENVGILERDYEALLDEDIGEFDYIVAHGVVSWVSPEKRKALIAFAQRKLKLGGLLHVSYNAMPGWAAVEPVRQLLLFGGGDQPSLERARRGVDFAKAMKAAGASYFAENPAANEMLDTMTRAGLPYVVHEYFHEHWAPMYFARLAWEMAASGLHFVGVLPLYANFREMALSEAQEKLLAGAKDRVTFESLKDFAVNEFFRRDVYVKGPIPAANDYFDETSWTALSSIVPPERALKLPNREVSLAGEAFETLLPALAAGSVRLGELPGDIDVLRAALIRLAIATHAVPTRPAAAPPAAYNLAMLRQRSLDVPRVLASTTLGTAVPISALEGVAIRALTESRDPATWVDDLLQKSVVRIRIGDRVIEDPADQRRGILEAVEQVRAARLAKLVALGMVSSPD